MGVNSLPVVLLVVTTTRQTFGNGRSVVGEWTRNDVYFFHFSFFKKIDFFNPYQEDDWPSVLVVYKASPVVRNASVIFCNQLCT